jgi:hypothetical protein
MRVRFSNSRLRQGLGAIAFALFAAAVPAGAQQMTNEGHVPMGPMAEMAQMNEPRDEFHLYSEHDVELIKFKQPHLLSLCDGRADPGAIGEARHAYPLQITFDGLIGMVEPGSCFLFEAQHVSVKPASRLPDNIVLSGTVRVIR